MINTRRSSRPYIALVKLIKVIASPFVCDENGLYKGCFRYLWYTLKGLYGAGRKRRKTRNKAVSLFQLAHL